MWCTAKITCPCPFQKRWIDGDPFPRCTQSLELINRFPQLSHDVNRVSWAASTWARECIPDASEQGASFDDFCDDCPSECEEFCNDSEDYEATKRHSTRTCHPGPDWVEVERETKECDAEKYGRECGDDDDMGDDSDNGATGSVEPVFNNTYRIPLFRVPQALLEGNPSFADDVCECMEDMVFGTNPNCWSRNHLVPAWFENVREGRQFNYAPIMRYHRWVQFVCETEKERDSSLGDKYLRHKRDRAGKWICCVLAKKDQPFRLD